MAIERILIHPITNPHNPLLTQVWDEWMQSPTTLVIPQESGIAGLLDVSFLDSTDPQTGLPQVRSELVLGGQTVAVCIFTHIRELAQHPSVKNGEVQICISEEATMTGMSVITKLAEFINNDFLVNILRVD